jgi:PAS domain S-box-containing protein
MIDKREPVSTRITAGYVTLMAGLGVSVFAAPAWAAPTWAAIGTISAGAILLGTRLHAPRRKAPWWLLAAAVLAMAAGDTIFAAAVHRPGDPSPAIVDACYLAMFPLVSVGFIQLTRTSAVLRDRTRLLDLLIFTCATALVSWVLVVSPGLSAYADSVDKSTLSAYALGDLLMLVTSVRLAVAARRTPAVALLTLGSWALTASNLVYTFADLGHGWRPGGPGELGYLLFYVSWGAAALQPSMAHLTKPVDPGVATAPRRWTVLLRLSLAVPAALLLFESTTGRPRDGMVIAIATVVMSALVITQLSDAVAKHQRALARERGLREACGALVAAADRAEVGSALRAAIGALLPPAVAHAVVYTPASGPATEDAGDGAAQEQPPGGYPVPVPAADRRTRLLHTRTLHPALREQLGHFEATLVCPLNVDHPACGPVSGALFVAAHEQVLAGMRDSVEVLTAHAALALERIALTDAVNRRDSDQYVRTVVQNTADVVLVLDDDGRIRYASRSLATVLGSVPPPFATLRDIVHPEDRDQVGRTVARARRSAEPDVRESWSLRRPDGIRVLVEVSCRDLRHDRMVRGLVITMRDVTERRSHDAERIRRALLGSPAGLNRRNSASKYR